ncbi:MAG: lytic transglycosylase domain-containing protein [Chloroherpetonaceae bacterium]|nr:lytic transglycosylase domain-containing protein [Chthonomonadaceae bacterium]MDW8208025.1 lytic transglycosylase domain-containing protein [Chloroherpetonaceae bacterium]
MMESRIHETLARVQELQMRLEALSPGNSPAPWEAPRTESREAALFDVALAQAKGQITLQPVTGSVGTFSRDIEAHIEKYARLNGLDPQLVRAVIQQESGGNPRAVSTAGAQGLMQLMPETAALYGVRDSFDPEQNIAAGTRHLAGLLREFRGDLPLALAAYNAGIGTVRRYGGIPPYTETRQYVQRILSMLGQ